MVKKEKSKNYQPTKRGPSNSSQSKVSRHDLPALDFIQKLYTSVASCPESIMSEIKGEAQRNPSPYWNIYFASHDYIYKGAPWTLELSEIDRLKGTLKKIDEGNLYRFLRSMCILNGSTAPVPPKELIAAANTLRRSSPNKSTKGAGEVAASEQEAGEPLFPFALMGALLWTLCNSPIGRSGARSNEISETTRQELAKSFFSLFDSNLGRQNGRSGGLSDIFGDLDGSLAKKVKAIFLAKSSDARLRNLDLLENIIESDRDYCGPLDSYSIFALNRYLAAVEPEWRSKVSSTNKIDRLISVTDPDLLSVSLVTSELSSSEPFEFLCATNELSSAEDTPVEDRLRLKLFQLRYWSQLFELSRAINVISEFKDIAKRSELAPRQVEALLIQMKDIVLRSMIGAINEGVLNFSVTPLINLFPNHPDLRVVDWVVRQRVGGVIDQHGIDRQIWIWAITSLPVCELSKFFRQTFFSQSISSQRELLQSVAVHLLYIQGGETELVRRTLPLFDHQNHREILHHFTADIVQKHPELAIITWSIRTATTPQLSDKKRLSDSSYKPIPQLSASELELAVTALKNCRGSFGIYGDDTIRRLMVYHGAELWSPLLSADLLKERFVYEGALSDIEIEDSLVEFLEGGDRTPFNHREMANAAMSVAENLSSYDIEVSNRFKNIATRLAKRLERKVEASALS